MVGDRHRFGEAFGLIVDSPWADRVHVSPVIFLLWMNQRVAVDLRGGGEQISRTFGSCQSQRLVGSEGAHLKSLDGELQVVDGARRARKMKNVIEGSIHLDLFRDVVLDKCERPAFDVCQVGSIAGDEVVHPDDGVALGKQIVDEMRADETRCAGD